MRSRLSAARSDAHQNVPKHFGPTIYPHTDVFQHAWLVAVFTRRCGGI